MPFHGSSTICSPSSMALARTTSSSAVSSATLPISLRYIRTGSSMPIMSALIASSSSAVGSSTSLGSSLVGPSVGDGRPRRAPSSATTSTFTSPSGPGRPPAPRSSRRPRRRRRPRPVRRRRRPRGAGAGRQLGLFEVGLGAAGSRQDGLHELLVERICGHRFLLGSRGSGAAATGRASRVCSRRSIDRSSFVDLASFELQPIDGRRRRCARPRPARLRCSRCVRGCGRPRCRGAAGPPRAPRAAASGSPSRPGRASASRHHRGRRRRPTDRTADGCRGRRGRGRGRSPGTARARACSAV